MSEFQWWVLMVGLAIGGTVVWLLTTTFARRDDDLEPDERDAEATFIASHLAAGGDTVDRATVARVLEAHREYLGLPAPVAIVPAQPARDRGVTAAPSAGAASAADRGPDDEAHDVGHGGRGPADRDLAEP